MGWTGATPALVPYDEPTRTMPTQVESAANSTAPRMLPLEPTLVQRRNACAMVRRFLNVGKAASRYPSAREKPGVPCHLWRGWRWYIRTFNRRRQRREHRSWLKIAARRQSDCPNYGQSAAG